MPAQLQHNPPYNRFKYIAKTYGDKHPDVVLATFFALADTVGIEYPEREFEFGRRYDFYGAPSGEAARRILDLALSELADDPRMRRGRESDALWPWLARELVRMKKRGRRARERGEMFTDWRRYVPSGKGPALALWQQANRIDLGQWSLTQALRALDEFEVDREEIPQGEVVHRWPDGWTVQQLGPEHLEAEGEVMQHCVGDYCEEVARGDTVIYSLRDPQGKPHVTMELSPSIRRFVQVYGKQNTRPKPEYMRRVDEFAATGDVRPDIRLTPEEEGELNEEGADLAAEAFDPSESGYTDIVDLDYSNIVSDLIDERDIGDRVWGDPDAMLALEEAGGSLQEAARDAVWEGVEQRWSELLDEGLHALKNLAWKLVDEVEDKVRSGELEDVDDVHDYVRDAYYNADYPFGPSDLEYLWAMVDENADLEFAAN